MIVLHCVLSYFSSLHGFLLFFITDGLVRREFRTSVSQGRHRITDDYPGDIDKTGCSHDMLEKCDASAMEMEKSSDIGVGRDQAPLDDGKLGRSSSGGNGNGSSGNGSSGNGSGNESTVAMGEKKGGEVEVWTRVSPGQEYIKLVVRGGKIVGALLIGDTDLEEVFENLILNELDVSRFGADLLDPDVDLEAYFD